MTDDLAFDDPFAAMSRDAHHRLRGKIRRQILDRGDCTSLVTSQKAAGRAKVARKRETAQAGVADCLSETGFVGCQTCTGSDRFIWFGFRKPNHGFVATAPVPPLAATRYLVGANASSS